MKTLKVSLSLMCLLTIALLLSLVGSRAYQTSQAASLEGCMVCIVCKGAAMVWLVAWDWRTVQLW